MLKNIFKEYFRVYQWSNIKEQLKTGLLIYWILIPFFCEVFLNKKIKMQDIVVFYAIFLPMIYAYLSGRMHPVRLKKMMYLCPMNEMERQRYIYRTYYFRVVFHMLVCGIGIAVLIPFSYCSLSSGMEILLCDFAVSIFIPNEKEEGINTEAVLRISIVFAALILNLVQMEIILEKGGNRMAQVIVLLVLVFGMFPLLMIYRKYIKETMNEAVNYEVLN